MVRQNDSRRATALVFILFFLAFVPLASAEEVRTWTDVSGKHKREAAFERLEKDTVYLRLQGGKEVAVPLSKLSADDQAYVRTVSRNTASSATNVNNPEAQPADKPASELTEDDVIAVTSLSKEVAERIISLKSGQKPWPEFLPDEESERVALAAYGVTEEQLPRLRDAYAALQSRYGGPCYAFEFLVRTSDPEWQRVANRFAELIVLPRVKQVTPESAAVLAKYTGVLILSGVVELGPEAARAFSGADLGLNLSGIEDLSLDTARALVSQGGPKSLNLSGLKQLSPEVARALSQFSNTLVLEGITELAPETAKYLARQKGHLHLPNVRTLTPETIEEFNRFQGHLILAGISDLSPAMAKTFAKGTYHLYLPSVKKLTVEQAEAFNGHSGSLSLGGIRQLDADVAGELAIREGWLVLDQLSELPVAVAESLAASGGPLALPGVASLSDESAKALSRRKQHTNLNGLTELSDEAAAALAGHLGKLELRGVGKLSARSLALLSAHKDRILLGEVTVGEDSSAAPPDAANEMPAKIEHDHQLGLVLTPEDARVLVSERPDNVDLSYVTSLSADVARVLGELERGILNLSGLRDLPEDVAEALARSRVMEVYCEGLESISAASLRAIAGGGPKYVHIDGVRHMSDDVFTALTEASATVLCGIEELPPKAGEILARKCPPHLWWQRVGTISNAELEAIVDNASTIALGVKTVTQKQAELLSRCKGRLILDSVVSLDVETARILTQHRGEISLKGLTSLAIDAKECLDRHGKVNYSVTTTPAIEQPYRSRDVGAVMSFSMREATQTHRAAKVLARTAMYGGPQGRVAELTKLAASGLESLDVPFLRKYRERVEQDDVTDKALAQIANLQLCAIAEMACVKSLADTDANDTARGAFVKAEEQFNESQHECRRAVWDATSHLSEATAVQGRRPDDVAMAMFFSFREISQTHLTSQALLLAALTAVPREEVLAECDKVLADFLVTSIPALRKYVANAEHVDRDRAVFREVLKLQEYALVELRAVRDCVTGGRPDQAKLSRCIAANERYSELGQRLAVAMLESGEGDGRQAMAADEAGEVRSPNEVALSDEEWANLVAVLRKKGVVRTARDAGVYFGTFTLLKSVFVEKKIREPTTDQLFGLAKVLNIQFGQMEPEKMEVTLRTMLQLAKETGTEVASRETLLKLGE